MSPEMNHSELKEFLLNSSNSHFKENIEFIHPVDILDVIHGEADEEIQTKILHRLPNEVMALLLDFEEQEDKYELLSRFSARKQSNLLYEMSSDEVADLVGSLEEDDKVDVLTKMNKEDREEINVLLSYKDDSAGSIMATEFISIRENKTVLKTFEYLQTYAKDAEMAYYLYVVDHENHLKGVISARDLISSSFDTTIQTITNPKVMSVHVDQDQEKVAQVFERYDYVMLPVVDDENRIVGVITIDDIVDIIKEEATEDIHRMAGLNAEEKIDGSLTDSIKSRLPWLSVNLVTAIAAAAVVALFSNTIKSVVALAAINPIIAGMGGNAGTQSLTIIVRGIALNELNKENALRIFFKEFGVGLFTGLVLGLVVGLGCYLIYGSAILGFVTAFAMISNLIIATVFGYFVPITLHKLKVDPALASSVFVTTATDVLGFFIFLGLATLCLPYLM